MQRIWQMVAWSICSDPMVWTLWSSEMNLRTRGCFASLVIIIKIIIIMTLLDNTITGRTSSSHCGPSFDIYSFHAACGCFVQRWGLCTLDIEWLYWGSEKGLGSSIFFPVWWGLVLALGWDTLTSWPVASFASMVALIASSFEMGS